MARSRTIYTLKEVAVMIGENLELLEEVTANSDNIAEGLQELLADIRTWDGGIREFLISEQCDPEMIERIMADELNRQS